MKIDIFFLKKTCLQINLSIDGDKGPIDIWHYDSIAYTGVVLLNKVEDMEGGELEIMNHEKNLALKLLENNEKYNRLQHKFVHNYNEGPSLT